MARWTLIFVFLAVGLANADATKNKCKQDLCPHAYILRYYEDIGCVPANGTDSCCPSSFNCDVLINLGSNQCQYRGVVYEKGMIIQDELEDNCLAKCTCRSSPRGTSFDCEPVNCPDYLVFPQLETGCLLQYNVDKCCSTGIYCDRRVTSIDQYIEPKVKCIYNGNQFVEGEFIIQPTCLQCVCQEGFDGTLNGPWCSKYSCDETLKRKNSEIIRCAPIFREDSICCTSGSHCPSSNDTIKPATNITTVNNDDHCTFGNLKLRIGDELSTDANRLKCMCNVPPFVTCLYQRK